MPWPSVLAGDPLAPETPPPRHPGTNDPTHVLARAISRLGGKAFQQYDGTKYVYPTAHRMAEVMRGGQWKPEEEKAGYPAATKKLLVELASRPAPEAGWTDQDIKKLGRTPKKFELSDAGQARDSHLQDQELLRSVASADHPNSVAVTSAAASRAAKEGRRYGESGWIGAIQNPEYAFGNVATGLQTTGDAAWSQASDHSPDHSLGPVRDDGTQEKITGYHHPIFGWVDDGTWDPAKSKTTAGAILASPLQGIGAAQKFLFHYLPAAADRRDMLSAANKVERILPAGTDRQEGNRLIDQTAQAAEPNFDDWYRSKFGENPSYALSSGAVFLNGLLDPTLLAGAPAAKASVMAGKALNAFGKGLSGGMVRDLIRQYGLSTVRASLGYSKYPILSGALKEAVDEGPTNVGVMAGLSLGPEAASERATLIEQPDGTSLYSRPHVPGYGPDEGASMFGGGKNRTDLLRPVKDAEGNLMGFKHETDEEFARRMEENATQGKALRQGTPGLMQQIENSKIRQPAITPVMSLSQPPF